MILTLVILVVILASLVAWTLVRREPIELMESNLFGYHLVMNSYFSGNHTLSEMSEWVREDMKHSHYDESSRGMDDALDVLESYGFPDRYDRELP